LVVVILVNCRRHARRRKGRFQAGFWLPRDFTAGEKDGARQLDRGTADTGETRPPIQNVTRVPKYEFDKCVAGYHGNGRSRTLPAYEHFLILAFDQLTGRDSLRDIETCLRSFSDKLYHAGIRQPVARSTLGDAHENRDWRICAGFAHFLIRQATKRYADEPRKGVCGLRQAVTMTAACTACSRLPAPAGSRRCALRHRVSGTPRDSAPRIRV
jgi:hypothetical protein